MRKLLLLLAALCISVVPAISADDDSAVDPELLNASDSKAILSTYTLQTPGARFRPQVSGDTEVVIATRGPVTGSPQDVWLSINKDIKAQRFELAIKKLDTLIASKKTLPEAYAKRAKCWVYLGVMSKAVMDSKAAIRKNPKLAEPYVVLGLCAMQRNDAQAAIAKFNQALANDSLNAEALLLRGQCFLAQGSFDEAVADMNKVLAKDSWNVDALWCRLRAYAALNRWSLAKSDGESIVKFEPSCPEGHVGLAMSLASLNQGYQCVPEFQKAAVCYSSFKAEQQAQEMRRQLARLIPMFDYGKTKSPRL